MSPAQARRQKRIEERLMERSERSAEDLLNLTERDDRPSSKGATKRRRARTRSEKESVDRQMERQREKLATEDASTGQVRDWSYDPMPEEIAWEMREDISPSKTLGNARRQDEAATRIQATRRMSAERQSFLEKKEAAEKLQQFNKMRAQRKEFLDKRDAAIKIQSIQRRNSGMGRAEARRREQEELFRLEQERRNEAAIKIQAARRGSAVRVAQDREVKDNAAAQIQRLQRGRMERQKLRREQEAAIKLQAFQRGEAVRKEMRERVGEESENLRTYRPNQILHLRDYGIQTDSRPPTDTGIMVDQVFGRQSEAPNYSLQMSDVWRLHKSGIFRLFKGYANKVGQNRTGFNSTFDKMEDANNTIDRTTFFQLCNDFGLFIVKKRKVDSGGKRTKSTSAKTWYSMWSPLVDETEFPAYFRKNGAEFEAINRNEDPKFEIASLAGDPVAFMKDAQDDPNSSPLIGDDGILPLTKEEVLAIFQSCAGEKGNFSRLDVKSFARALYAMATKGIRRLFPSQDYIKQVGLSEPQAKEAFRTVAIPLVRRLKFRSAMIPLDRDEMDGPFSVYDADVRAWYATIPIQTCMRGYLQRRRYRCAKRAYLAVSEIFAVTRMLRLTPAQCSLALLNRMRVANPGALRRKLMETSRGFIFDANAGSSVIKWSADMIKKDAELDNRIAQEKIDATLAPARPKQFANVKAKVDSNRPTPSRRSANKAVQRQSTGTVDTLTVFAHTESGENSSNILSSSAFPSMSMTRGSMFENQQDSNKSSGSTVDFDPLASQFGGLPGANWLDDMGVKGQDTETLVPFESFKKEHVGLRKSLTAPNQRAIRRRADVAFAMSSQSAHSPRQVERARTSRPLPRVAKLKAPKEDKLEKAGWNLVEDDAAGNMPLKNFRYSPITAAPPPQWQEMEQMELETLTNGFQKPDKPTIKPRRPPVRQNTAAPISFSKHLHLDAANRPSPLKATRVLTSRQITNSSKYMNR